MSPLQPTPMQVATAPLGSSYWSIVRRQLRRNRLAIFGLRCVILLLLTATYAPLLASDRPFYYSGPEGTEWPWLTDLFDRLQVTQAVDLFFNLLMLAGPPLVLAYVLARRWFRRHRVWQAKQMRRTVFVLAGVFLWVFVSIALPESASRSTVGRILFAPGVIRTSKPAVDYHQRIAEARAAGHEPSFLFPPLPYHYDKTRVGETSLPPDWFLGERRTDLGAVGKHPLGTDQGGKDVAAGLLYGTRISMTIGVIAVAIYITIGVILGSLAGYFGRWVDIGISRFIEVMMCFPVLFFILTVISVFETRTIFLIMVAIGLTGWPSVARLVRGEFLRERSLDYVTAARAMAVPQRRVIFRHVLPNALTPVLVSATFGIASSILYESVISFLGLGDATTASWGLMLNKGRQSNLEWLILAPGAAIFFTVTVFNLLGEGLRDALDPKMRA